MGSRARRFLLGHGQSALGTGAGHVALVLLAVQLSDSPWAVTLVLLADFLPSMVLSPLLGAVVDRTSPRRMAILADLLRAAAFGAMPFADSLGALVFLALAAGLGSAIFQPASLAALPQLTSADQLPKLTSLHSALSNAGIALGPAIAAALLLVVEPDTVLAIDGATFLVSALCIASIRFGGVARPSGKTLRADTVAGVRAVWRDRVLRITFLTAGGMILLAGTWNVGEVFLARDALDSGDTGFALIIAFSGCGIVAGSLAAARTRTLPLLRSRFLAGVALVGVAGMIAGLAPVLVVALVAFLAGGFGNAYVVVHLRMVVQRVAPRDMLARAYAAIDSVTSWGFAVAFLCAGTLLELIGPRALFVGSGAACLVVWACAATTLPQLAERSEPVSEVQAPAA